MPSTPNYGSVPFVEQTAFFRRKLNLPTAAWTDIYTREHDWAFVVAGANRDAIVADFRQAVEKAITDGTTLQEFRKDFDRIVATHGWDYNGGRNWRSRVIYETNLRTSYAAGRYGQLQAVKSVRPYWQYVHSDAVTHPRPHHLAWNGTVLRADDPWWDTHFGPNGWGCQCRVIALNDRDLRRLGKTGPDTAPEIRYQDVTIGQRSAMGPRTVRVPEGIDPGFEYTPGKSRYHNAMPSEIRDASRPQTPPGLPARSAPGPLPAPRRVRSAELLPPQATQAEALQRFLAPFGATSDSPSVFRDVVGERLVMGRELFEDAQGQLQVVSGDRDRDRYLLLLADTLRAPDEIWTRLEWMPETGKAVVRRRYMSRYVVEGTAVPLLVVYERGADGWLGFTELSAAGAEDVWRIGVRLYRRSEN